MVSSRIAESAPKVDARNASSSCANTSGAGFFFLKNIGRGIGYDVIEHVPPQDVHDISATKIREQMKLEGKL